MEIKELYAKILRHATAYVHRITNPIMFELSKLVPDKLYLEHRYKRLMGKKLNLNPPVTYNEKLNWIKLYDRNPLYTKLADKYAVREYVKERIGEEHIMPLLGVWDKVDDIDFDLLPDQFVLKCTHDSGSVVICKDKASFDIKSAKCRLLKAQKVNYYYYSREWAYKNITPRIICEPYLEDLEDAELRDYKFFCFDGIVRFLYVATDRFNPDSEVKFSFFDEDYNHIPVVHGHPVANPLPSKPNGFEQMKHYAEKLSRGLKHVRVDLYEANGKIYFSEFFIMFIYFFL